MQLETYIPAQRLRPFVKAYKFIECASGSTNRIVPDASFSLALRLNGQISYLHGLHKTPLPSVTFAGLQKTVRLIDYAQASSAVIIQFKETGVPAFFNRPPALHELYNRSVAFDNILPASTIATLEQQLADSSSRIGAIAIIDQFLISRLTDQKPDMLVTEALSRIHTAKGNIRIKELAKSLYISQDAFEKRFRKITGASPKQFSKIVKMNGIVQQKLNKTLLADLVYDNGYFDQPHFIKDFKDFTGLTPSDFIKSPVFW